jgi:hypothetical protein
MMGFPQEQQQKEQTTHKRDSYVNKRTAHYTEIIQEKDSTDKTE